MQQQDEFVIGGWTEPKRRALALRIADPGRARRRRGALVYAGDVGTGFTARSSNACGSCCEPLATEVSPFDAQAEDAAAGRTGCEPRLVAQVRYTEMTDDGRLRHPAYLGLRDDKRPREVTHRDAADRGADAGGSKKTRAARQPADGVGRTRRRADRRSSTTSKARKRRPAAAARRRHARRHQPAQGVLARTGVHQGRPAALLRAIAPLILPVVDDRPLVMKRLPNGVDGQSFYQHRAPEPVPPRRAHRDAARRRRAGAVDRRSLKTLLYMAQLASISMDPWFSTIGRARRGRSGGHRPRPAARARPSARSSTWRAGSTTSSIASSVPGFPKTSGSEGLHIFIPLPAGHAVRGRHAVLPDRRDDGRRQASEGRDRGADGEAGARTARSTSTTCRTSRARRWRAPTAPAPAPFAGVSTPLTWDEIDGRISPQDFTIQTIEARVAEVGDLWERTRTAKRANLAVALDKLQL